MVKLRELAGRTLSGLGSGPLATLRGGRVPATARESEPLGKARTVTIVPAGSPIPTVVTSTQPGGGGGWLFWTSILAGVVAPFLLALVYFGWIATAQFTAEARFAVRSLDAHDTSMGSGGGGSGGSRMLATTPLSQDAYVVTSYIHSPAIIDAISAKLDLKSLFEGDQIDWWSRLPQDATREDMLEYWTDQVTTYLDGPSGIITLQVRAFTPEDAKSLASAIIEESEFLANELSRRAREDYVKRAEQEAMAREGDYKSALQRLNALQNETTVLDPTLRATETGTLLTNLLAQKLDIDARLFVLAQQSTDSPAVRQLQRTQAAIEAQIQDLRSQLADSGTVNTNLSETFRRFAELETERTLAAQIYSAARRNFAQAQTDAIRKAVYVTTFVQPELAEDSRYPRRIATPLLILLGLSVTWGILALLIASVEDHRT